MCSIAYNSRDLLPIVERVEAKFWFVDECVYMMELSLDQL